MDNYYKGHTFMDEQKSKGKILNWDQPEALDLELFYKHLSELKK
jgi:uridine kinase